MNRFLLILTTAVCAAMLLAGCSNAETTSTSNMVGPAYPPVHVDRTTPESAVRAYLDGITFTYRMANSEAASDTMTAWEYVRVDSYVELNRQEGRALEQTLTSFEVRDMTSADPTVTVDTYEEWAYRYFSIDTLEYASEEATIAYDASYTVVKQPDSTWLVDKVEVTPLSGVE